MTIVGVNLSDQSAEAVALNRTWLKKIKVVGFSRITLPDGVVVNGRILKPNVLVDQLRNLWASAKPYPLQTNTVRLSIPESQIYSRVLSFPAAATWEQIGATIQAQLSHYIPFNPTEVVYDFVQLGQRSDKVDVLLAAVDKAILQSYQVLADTLGWRLQALELESISSARAILPALPPGQVIGVIDLGARTTIVSFFDHTGLRFTFNIPLAGNQLTTAIAEYAKLSAVEAEQQKCTVGLTGQSGVAAKVTAVLQKNLELLAKKIMEAQHYFETNTGMAIGQLQLIGGTAQLPGLVDWFGKVVNVPCALGKVLPTIVQTAIVKTLGSEEILYSNALGLALGAVALRPDQHYINFVRVKH